MHLQLGGVRDVCTATRVEVDPFDVDETDGL
eukprot:SAG11_NODE_10420_length_833_cov_0.780654_3_plen_30_part_01